MSASTPIITLEALVTIGGRDWRSSDGSKHRVYLNDLIEFYPTLEVSYYGTGNVSSARLDGDRISNTKARRILQALDGTKLWWDANTQEWGHRAYGAEELVREIIKEIEERIQEATGGAL